ncbi:FAD-dependent oxidoreductase [Agromyces marinus]|uniref:Fused response regulator/thioredoxin-disulfide reductase n=1 Tax=Agromyces marinus TaxID=1389020 RepID=A0ABN6YFL6_9MICO|nr:FAD-dependent oxidoreductase [Agromyces marinus]UIP59016.1 Ferredoxin--NADP reductase [Agromyces marinus]BDZ56008.1 fused response regulator/thioredoxin-disulfide reductase [Agromyces marinus]
MAKPVIMTVDDEPQVLSAIARDLSARYRDDYRIVRAGSGADALDAVQGFKRRGDRVALFLVDQRMPGMTGTEFLAEALTLYPDAKRVLLTAYADTSAAITSINSLDLDYYLLKPWDPPEERLYPVIDELVDDWRANTPPLYEGIRVAGTLWSPTTHVVKDFLARSQIPYQWLDIEKNDGARALVEASSDGMHRLPVVFLPDGTTLFCPSLHELAERIGLRAPAQQPFYDLIVIGAGPAGLAAAVYGASEGLRTAVVEREVPGGQAGTSSRIENYLGFPHGISGADLARRAVTQARRLGAEILSPLSVTAIRVEDSYKIVELDDGSELRSRALVLATGVEARVLGIPGEERLLGASVYYGAAASEAMAYSGRRVVVVGGANSAGQGAMFLSRYAAEVVILVRKDGLESSMSRYLIDQIEAAPNVTVRAHSRVVALAGDDRLESMTVADTREGTEFELAADAMFVFIGAVPGTDLVRGLVELDEHGFVLTGTDLVHEGRRPHGWTPNRDPFPLEASIPGVFAAGDVRHDVMRRVASAVGQGAVAVNVVHKYLETV